jgi:hypothetical protein
MEPLHRLLNVAERCSNEPFMVENQALKSRALADLLLAMSHGVVEAIEH